VPDEKIIGSTHAEFIEDKMRRLSCHQIAHECRLGLAAAQNLDAALEQGNRDQVWLAIRGVLACAANVGKILWPNPKDKDHEQAVRARGKHLCHSLGMNRLSPLYPRAVRDGFEHIEERLDRWFKKGGNYLDLEIGPLDAGLLRNGVTVLRHFDPGTGAVRVLDKTANLSRIVGALRELEPKADAASLMPLKRKATDQG
jgi:hypothetical protein